MGAKLRIIDMKRARLIVAEVQLTVRHVVQPGIKDWLCLLA
jgi:hypothetical protein